MIVITGANAVYGAEYADVKQGHWAYEAVSAMSDRSIIRGYPNGSFLPDNTITYGEFIKMALIAGTGEDVGNAASGHWASNYYDKALELKYFNSRDINKAYLGSRIPRGDMALIISSILGDTEMKNYDELQKGLTDVNYQTKHEYDITKSYAAGILTGYTDHTFRPDQTLSRAESATVIHRLVDGSKRKLPDVGGKDEKTGTKTEIKSISGGKTWLVTSYDVKLGYGGIERIEVDSKSGGDILVYSTVCYEVIRLYLDNVMMSGAMFTTGLEYYMKDGYYVYDVYVASDDRNKVSIAGKNPILKLDNTENVYRYIDVTL